MSGDGAFRAAFPLGNKQCATLREAFEAGFKAGAEWERKEALREAAEALRGISSAVDMSLTAFPSHWAIDEREATDAIRALAEGDG